MSSKANMKVSTRLSLGIGAILVLMLAVATIGLTRLSNLNSELVRMSDDRVPKIITASDWLFRLMESARHSRNMLILDDPEKIKAEIVAIHDDKRARKEYMEELQKTVVTPTGKASLQEVIDSRTAYTPAEDAYIKLVESGDMVAAKAYLLQTMRPLQLTYVAKLRNFIDSQKKVIHDSTVTSAAEYASGRNLIGIFSLLALAVASIAGWFLTRSLVRQIGAEPAYVVDVADQIAAGDLATDITTRDGDTSSILYSMKQMRDSLSGIVGEHTRRP